MSSVLDSDTTSNDKVSSKNELNRILQINKGNINKDPNKTICSLGEIAKKKFEEIMERSFN